MQITLTVLTKKAIDAALKQDWNTAIEVNQEILEKNPADLDAKIRLGRALINVREFDKAKRIFKEVLKLDPINNVALKNLEIAKKERVEHKVTEINVNDLLIEPGKSAEVKTEITAKGITAHDFLSGETVQLKIRKKSIGILKIRKDDKLEVAEIIDENMVRRINSAVEMLIEVSATYIKGEKKVIYVLLKATAPIFKADKQDVRPYIKKGSFVEMDEEDELELMEGTEEIV